MDRVWLVDGFNAIQTALLGGRDRDGWWGAATRSELLERAEAFDDPTAEIWVVFDGGRPIDASEPREETSPRLRQVFAVSADAWLIERVRAAPDPAALSVVTRDRSLAERVRRRGARVVAPIEFLKRCGPLEAPSSHTSG